MSQRPRSTRSGVLGISASLNVADETREPKPSDWSLLESPAAIEAAAWPAAERPDYQAVDRPAHDPPIAASPHPSLGRLADPRHLQAVIFLAACVFSFSLLRSHGDVDAGVWLLWIANISEHGLVGGYIANHDMYPPLTSVILYAVLQVSALADIPALLALKLFIFGFLLLTSLIFRLWTNDWLFAIAVHVAFILNTMALSYIDIFIAPFLLASLYALHKRWLALFSVLYFFNVMIKWQGLIMLPFIVLYLLDISSLRETRRIQWARLASRVALPSVTLLTITLLAFGSEVYRTFHRALHDDMLSGHALNLNWIFTRVIHLLNPERDFFEHGVMRIVHIKGGAPFYMPRAIFWCLFLAALLAFFKEAKSFEQLLKFSVIGYLVYFTFNPGVHENHLFVAALLAVVILNYDPGYLTKAIGIVLAFNMNLFMFYGAFGDQPNVQGYFGAEVSIILAACFTMLFAMMYLPVVDVLARHSLSGRRPARAGCEPSLTVSLLEGARGWGTVPVRAHPDRGGEDGAASRSTEHDQVPEAAGAVQDPQRLARRM